MIRPRLIALAAAAVSVLAVTAADASAKIGTGVGAAPISLTAAAHAGRTYDLPSLWVVNTGDEAGVYRVRVDRAHSPGGARAVPTSWVAVGRSGFGLAPGQGTWVALSLRVPAGAQAGRYRGVLVADTVRQNVGGAGVGAAAATDLNFTVDGAVRRAERQSALGAGWAPFALLFLGVGGAITAYRRRRNSRANT